MEDRLDRIITIGEAILLALQTLKLNAEIPLNRKQAAQYLGVCESSIRNYARRGLKKTVANGIAGYLPSDLEKFRK